MTHIDEDEAFAAGVIRPPLGARVREAFWAMIFGSGAAIWLFALIMAMHKSELISGGKELAAFSASLLLGVGLGVFAGFRRPLSGYGSLLRRTAFVLVIGVFVAVALFALVLAVAKPWGSSDYVTAFGILVAIGLAFVAAAMARFVWIGISLDDVAPKDLPVAKRRRLISLVVLGALSACSLFGVSPGARCYGGSASSCAVASAMADDGSPAQIRYARLGCARGDAACCGRTGALLFSGHGATTDTYEAETFVRKGCALDGAACANLKRLELEEGCASYHAFACLELSQNLGASGQPNAERAREMRVKACRLGLDAACQ